MIYLDYAATSYKKPKCVYKAVWDALIYHSANPGRGGHTPSVRAGEIIYDTREKLSRLLHNNYPEQIAFFPNTTMALNAGIKGILKQGDHVVVSSMEHNSVIRPLETLKNQGLITYSLVSADENGSILAKDFTEAMKPGTKLVICTHASNVCGNIYDINELSNIAKRFGAYFMVDAAQSIGTLTIDVKNIDLMAFPGHKSLYGPQGTGGLYVKKGILLNTIAEGGTGSQSELAVQPLEMPDRLEVGTLNVPAIAGLGAAVDFILTEGAEAIYAYEHMLMEKFTEDVLNMKGISIYGSDNKVSVVALNIQNMDCVEVSQRLNQDFGISVRSGLHCAYAAHKTLGTDDIGCVRFSFGYFNTKKEIKKAVDALHHIIKYNA